MTRMSASEAFVETLVAHGVTDVFGIVGSAYMDALDLFPAAGIRFWSVQHEQNAAHMADGYSRASGKHGVCIAQNGPGVTNFVTGIAAAYWAHSPVVAVTPEAGTMTKGHGGFQEVDQLPIFQPITRYQAHVNRPERIAELTHRAFELALLERGPTQINIPRDYFYGEYDYRIPQPFVLDPVAGAPESLDRAAEMIAGAEFPVILSGGGVVMGGGMDEVVRLADFLEAPVASSYLHNDSFPASHRLALGPLGYLGSKAAMRVLAQADLVLALGCRLGPFGTLPQYGIDYWPAKARIIQVDRDHRVLGLTRPVDLPIQGDAGRAAAAILERLETGNRTIACRANAAQRLAEVERQKEAWESELNALSAADGSPIPPRRALRELERALPASAMVSTDIGNICSTANSYLRFERAPSFFAAMSFGNCGYAFPTAMGAWVASPQRPAIAYVGDGAWGMSLHEVLTCVREGIPVVAVVFNNGQWGAEKRNQIDYYANRFLGTELENPSFAAIARAMGAGGVRVETPDQIGDALRAAISSERCTVLEILVSRELSEPFRRDALRKPRRLLPKYAHLSVD